MLKANKNIHQVLREIYETQERRICVRVGEVYDQQSIISNWVFHVVKGIQSRLILLI